VENKFTFLKNYFLRVLPFVIIFILPSEIKSQTITYTDSWYEPGLKLASASSNGIEINYSTYQFEMNDVDINGTIMKKIVLPGVFLPNNEGAPDLPGLSRYIAVPQGADVTFQITASRTENFTNVDVAPAPRIPLDTDPGPLYYKKNQTIYSSNSYYPENPVILSSAKKIRGVDARIIGITPFQYNPVTKELIVYRDLKVTVRFTGGNGQFGENRLRNRWWDPVLMNIFLNSESLPKIDYNHKPSSRTDQFEYIIITPDNPTFLAWADSIKNWRTLQGISTGIVTLTEIGGNNATLIENYINNAYYNWTEVPPVAVLFLGDYGTGGATGNGIISPTYSGYVSDNLYADVDGDMLPDLGVARLLAQNDTHLNILVEKFLNYERNPPVNPSYFENPIAAGGWQSDRWFILCADIVHGFWEYGLSISPKREFAGYSGPPPYWSTNTNTSMVVNYFGPNGLGYIPQLPTHLTDWGGNATRINNDINSGASIILHRDHGEETGWSSPSYHISDLSGLNNDDLTFFFSINCLTGKYNLSSECFCEALTRYPHRALGAIGASEVSYSFVNDTYVWGMWDYMWPDFDPGYGVSGPDLIYPTFASAYGKYYLEASSWPSNPGSKNTVYYLFHMFGDAFTTVYTEMPQNLTVIHDPVIITGVPTFDVTADANSLIALTLNGEILGVAEGTGTPVSIEIPVINPGNVITLTVTKQNYYRYTAEIQVVPAEGPYVIVDSCIVNDASGNNDGLLDYGESPLLSLRAQNVGIADANNVTINISSQDQYITITDSSEFYGVVPAGGTVTVNNGYALDVDPNVPDLHVVPFSVVATDGANNWQSNFSLTAHAPVLSMGDYSVYDPGGNNNGLLDPGETADVLIEIKNTGTSGAVSVSGELTSTDPNVVINTSSQVYGNIASGESVTKAFSVSADENTPPGHRAYFGLNITADPGLTAQDSLSLVIGQVPVLVLCLDPNHSSSPAIKTCLDVNEVTYDYATTFPPDLSLYRSIFVCLGIFSDNHVLTTSEGQLLADFLDDGGMIYMEGGDTWYYDPSTPVHSMFNINPVSDGSGDLGTIQGVTGTFTEGMSFSYTGENSWIDHISNIPPAYMIFNNVSPAYGCAVAYDAGTYKTIGASFEFGGLADGSLLSTKDELMSKIVDFFDLNPIPVELTSFRADVDEGGITIKWETSTETNNSGFDIERSTDNNKFEKIGNVKGNGTTTEAKQYSFKDGSITTGKGKVYYRLKQIDFDGTSKYTDAIEVEYSIIPVEFSLSQNYPNPFNPTTTIKFGIPKEAKVVLKVYDILGEEIATIVNQKLEPGYYKYEWNGSQFASGVYFYRIEAGSFVKIKKMMIIK
jgi:hypothetical protein